MKPRVWMLSYDMADNRRRKQVADLALRHGERHQKSLYLLNLDYDQNKRLQTQLRQIANTSEDRILMRPVCKACRQGTRFQGQGGKPEQHEPFWIF